MTMPEAVRAYMLELARKGGRTVTPKKLAHLEKARAIHSQRAAERRAAKGEQPTKRGAESAAR
jgi:hypothetical protein